MFDFQSSVQQTAASFVAERPGQVPDNAWLAMAASVDRVPDEQWRRWFDEVRKAVAYRETTAVHALSYLHTLLWQHDDPAIRSAARGALRTLAKLETRLKSSTCAYMEIRDSEWRVLERLSLAA